MADTPHHPERADDLAEPSARSATRGSRLRLVLYVLLAALALLAVVLHLLTGGVRH